MTEESGIRYANELIRGLVGRSCTLTGRLDSMGSSTLAEALEYLERIGAVVILRKQGDFVEAKWAEKTEPEPNADIIESLLEKVES